MAEANDTMIIGGGFFGLSIARYLRTHLKQKRVVVIEKENEFMRRASYNNQARVHGGYHYPRSLLTGLRSQVNFSRFVAENESAIEKDFDKYYAIARQFSKVSARQFKLFCDRISAEVDSAPKAIKDLFNNKLIEDVFKVKEYAFNADIIRDKLVNDLANSGVELYTGKSVRQIFPKGGKLVLETEDGKHFETKNVLNCTYSHINKLNKASHLPFIPLKHELAEMCLIDLPKELEKVSVTVMCGPFFSFMPFPVRNLTTLSHVRYTPHSEWPDNEKNYRDGHAYLEATTHISHFPKILADAKRYLPALGSATYKDSLWEVKTVLPQSERDDSRPILFRKNNGLPGYHCIMGGKLDNIYDAFRELDILYG